MTGHQNFSSHTAVTKQRYQISRGTKTSHGSYQVLLKTTLFRFGRWLTAYLATKMLCKSNLPMSDQKNSDRELDNFRSTLSSKKLLLGAVLRLSRDRL